MHARFLLGPAGSGKTHRCLTEIRAELERSPDGPDLLLLAPKQATFQLERQLLAEGAVQGFTRLRILSFERLAAWVFEQTHQPLPELLSEEGRVMVLRALLEQKQGELRVFRASARLAGFARHLSALLRQFQERQIGPDRLEHLAANPDTSSSLADKLRDLALLSRALETWITAQAGETRIEDAPRLLDAAAAALKQARAAFHIGGLWLDGFAEMTPQEQTLLAAVLPHCAQATLAFCLPAEPREDESWLSPWALVSQTAWACYHRATTVNEARVSVELMERDPERSRFRGSALLAHVERVMAGDSPVLWHTAPGAAQSLRLVQCASVEAEAALAAREILTFVRAGARFRDCAILVRSLERYQDILRRVLTRYEVPFFLDRRESVSHHPLAELTRFALRTVAFDWQPEDWLGALKTGLSGLTDYEVDRLENAALARGWHGARLWLNPLPADEEGFDRERLETWRQQVVPPFAALRDTLHAPPGQPTGPVLAGALRSLWDALGVESQLEAWARNGPASLETMHATVWDQVQDWLSNLERAFRTVSLSLSEWLQIIEAGLSGLTVGVVPPALDQVLVGSVDRSRNPDLRFALVLGVNESVFPAAPGRVPLLTEADTEALEKQGLPLNAGRRRFGHERYLGYIAFTRARERLLVTWSASDAQGHPANPSRFVDDLRRAFPEAPLEEFDGRVKPQDAAQVLELLPALAAPTAPQVPAELATLGVVQTLLARARHIRDALAATTLSAPVATALYGAELSLSVSGLESFAACPFQFFIARGLKAQERDEFAVDARRTGEFQHAVLQGFHRRLLESQRRWRELTPKEAAHWVCEIGTEELRRNQHGLFAADAARTFLATALLGNLQQLVAQLTTWARAYAFEPAAIEVGFGLGEDSWPAWRLDLGNGRAVNLRGRVDRVDLCRMADGRMLVAILDYKSSGKEFKALKFAHGLELQMPAYLSAILHADAARHSFQASELIPAGVFYVGLRPRSQSAQNRLEAGTNAAEAARTSFQHRGRFDAAWVEQFAEPGTSTGQFKYRFTKNGDPYKTGSDAIAHADFAALMAGTTQQIEGLARRILEGEAAVSPYKLGSEVACDRCAFRPVCRFDPWVQPYRVLKPKTEPPEDRGRARLDVEAAPCR